MLYMVQYMVMMKTTVYLPERLKRALERMAAEEGRSEAEIIRGALQAVVESRQRPRPRLPINDQDLGDPGIAENVDRYLSGFGES